jgi:hypothetical protein
MALSTKTINFQRVQVAVPGTSVALDPQPFDNTLYLIIYNRGTNVLRLGICAGGTAITVENGNDIPAGAALQLPIGVRSNRPGPAFAGANSLCLDVVGGGGDAQVAYVNTLGQ